LATKEGGGPPENIPGLKLSLFFNEETEADEEEDSDLGSGFDVSSSNRLLFFGAVEVVVGVVVVTGAGVTTVGVGLVGVTIGAGC
jgi:hypothetical protein